MAQWYVKDLSKLTEVSVQTLHHYDRIGLLKPSVRLPNGYRLYSEKDLLKLQQVIALKFFGFELAQIKTLLSAEVNMIDHFVAQSQFLEERSKTFLEASITMKNIISECGDNKSIPWETIIKSIEVYRMTEKLKNKWAGKVFNSDELKEYVKFEEDVKVRYTETEKKAIENAWHEMVKEVDANLDKDPASKFGIQMGKRCMDWVNKFYGKNIHLRNAIWEKGFKGGNVDHAENTLSAKGVEWLDKAIDAYYRDRIEKILDQVGKESNDKVSKLWAELLSDMYGDDAEQQQKFLTVIMADPNINESIKIWLKQTVK